MAADVDTKLAGSDLYKALALVVATVIFGAIWVILRTRGFLVRLGACVFVVSLVSTQLLMKALGSEPFRFRFPALVTTLHFTSVWAVCVVYWVSTGDVRKCWPSSLGSARRYFTLILPIALSLPLSVVFNNQALLYIGAGLTGIIGTIAPITTAVLSHVLGRAISRDGWVGVSVACVGGSVIAWGEYEHNKAANSLLRGFVFALSGVFLRSAKTVLQDQLLAPNAYADRSASLGAAAEPDKPMAPMHVWALQAPPCIAMALSYTLAVESLPDAWAKLTPGVAAVVGATAVSATVLNLLGMFIIKQLGASSMQIIGKLNTVILVAFSVAFLGEVLPQAVVFGTVLVLAGIALFEHAAAAAHGASEASRLPTLDPFECRLRSKAAYIPVAHKVGADPEDIDL